MKSLNVAIAGLGTVGVGTFKIIREQADLLTARTGANIGVSAVSARSKDKDRGIDTSDVTWYDNAVDIADDTNTDIVIELMGGSDGSAYDLVKASLANGKHVVTANKALIAIHGVELAKLAEENNVALLFEAAVAGGIPILKTLREGLAANNFSRISGIMNGTCNFILSAMAEEKRGFDDVLAEAQELGYAETPPDLDVDGIDTAHKLAIITSLAYGTQIDFNAIYCEGIRNVSLDDIQYAAELGYNIKLLGITNKTSHGIEQRVHPCLISNDVPIASVNGALNAVLVECDQLGDALITGAGAGAGPTASSVMADVMDIAAKRTSPSFGQPFATLAKADFVDISHHEGEYYIRINVKDESGVLASVTSALSEADIGVERVLQKADDDGTAQIALTTHKTSEDSIQKALQSIAQMDYVIDPAHLIRIEDFKG
jgi:homoserine dehydrogenase